MKICITLDDVLRAKTLQFGTIYKKNINPDIDLNALDMSSGNLEQIFGFTKNEYNNFLYNDYAFDIFAEAPMCERMLDKKLNLWHISLSNREDNVELMLSNPREFNASIGYTYFFLSQAGTRIREVFLPKDYSEIWNKCDILVTADVNLLNEKPDNCITIKIETDYNKNCNSDYSYESLSKFLDDDKIIDEISNKLNDNE